METSIRAQSIWIAALAVVTSVLTSVTSAKSMLPTRQHFRSTTPLPEETTLKPARHNQTHKRVLRSPDASRLRHRLPAVTSLHPRTTALSLCVTSRAIVCWRRRATIRHPIGTASVSELYIFLFWGKWIKVYGPLCHGLRLNLCCQFFTLRIKLLSLLVL